MSLPVHLDTNFCRSHHQTRPTFEEPQLPLELLSGWSTKQTYSARDFAVLKNTTTGKPALPLSWIHSKIISAATIRIIGLTKIAKIECLPLDWIYRSIQIMMVSTF